MAMENDFKSIAQQFLAHTAVTITPITNGLINNTYKVVDIATSKAYILQKINTDIFKNPLQLQHNYTIVKKGLLAKHSRFVLPAIIPAIDGQLYFIDGEKNSWRMFDFVLNSTTIAAVNSPEQAYIVANTFGVFTNDVKSIDVNTLHPIIQNFHNLLFRHQQLLDAIKTDAAARLHTVKKQLEQLEKFTALLKLYNVISNDTKNYGQYILHHDAKISNILFDKNTLGTITPIDIDTTMPGYFFSDVGDMIRSMAINKDENCTTITDMEIMPLYYEAIIDGYLTNTTTLFTINEVQQIHYSGLIIVYMQCMRFITDYINGDTYYQIEYPQNNFDRANNQLYLLQLLAQFVQEKYGVKI
jgi:thiamine kinase-like enzyme